MVIALTVVLFMLAGTSPNSASTPACGVRGPGRVTGAKTTGPSSQIIGGVDAQPLEFPWLISLQLSSPPDTDNGHSCGGSIINKQYIITAAHCIDEDPSPSSYVVAVGEHLLNQTDPHERKIALSDVQIYPKWDRGTAQYDYAILKLKTPLDFSGADKALMPICLPTENQMFEDQTCTLSGWGCMSDALGAPGSQILQKVDLPIVSFEECENDYISENEVVEEIMICAGFKEGGKSHCTGDSGGPLQCPREDGRYVLAGTSSWGIDYGAPNQPSVFARTSTQLDWIKSVAGETP